MNSTKINYRYKNKRSLIKALRRISPSVFEYVTGEQAWLLHRKLNVSAIEIIKRYGGSNGK